MYVGSHAHADATAPTNPDTNTQQPSPSPPPQPSTTKSTAVAAVPAYDVDNDIINWSGTHSVTARRFYQPESVDELRAIVRYAHDHRVKIRPVGSALSPNGLPLNETGMISVSALDRILSVDVASKQVRVQAGARVSQVVEALRPYGLTLRNFASITEQQVGGFTQVGAHGTGVDIATVDEQVIAVRLVTPAAGEIELSENDEDPTLFHVARASLGLMGVVCQLTIQCVDAHKLVETTTVMSHADVVKSHHSLLRENRHLRYMWIPNTDRVVVVTCNPVDEDRVDQKVTQSQVSMNEKLKHVRQLLMSHRDNKLSHDKVDALQFTALRDELLVLDPLNVDWVRRINHAEADFWAKSQGTRVDWSDRILQFDCGGQQWVSEVAFPVYIDTDTDCNDNESEEENDNQKQQQDKVIPSDIQYMLDLVKMIDDEEIAAPSPLEQRWSAPSSSPMSLACERAEKQTADYYSWVGVIMYLPDETVEPVKRQRITHAFKQYKTMCELKLWPKVGAVEHWAKIEMPATEQEAALLQQRTTRKYPVEAFKAICSIFDPHGVLRNDLTETIFGPVPFP